MRVAKVIGTIWATRKDPRLSGLTLLLVQPLNVLDGAAYRVPLVCADTIGAGVGETVLLTTGSGAGGGVLPVDATVVGIVDDSEIDVAAME
ncbi:MAG: EutN/CcmL family microcompartment protein [Pseudoflavonifractor sp.]